MCRPEERRDFGVCDYVIANPKDGFLQLADSEDFTHLVTHTNKLQPAAVVERFRQYGSAQPVIPLRGNATRTSNSTHNW